MDGPFYDANTNNAFEIEIEDATSTGCSLSGIKVCYASLTTYYMKFVSFNMTGTDCSDLTWGDNGYCDDDATYVD